MYAVRRQIARHVNYDTEYGFELPRKVDSPIVCSSVPAAQVWTCGHRNPPAQDRQDPKCTMLVVQREQSNSRSPPAEMSEVGKAARLNAVRAECEKGLDQCKAGPSRPEDSIWKRGRRRSTSVHKKHRNGQVAG
jgi:hypothetical protein